MNYSMIDTFLTILKMKNITKASEVLHLSQSTVTQKLKSLEKDLGVTLFIRNRGVRHIELTSQGREFIDIAERYKVLLKDAYNIKNLNKNLSLTIGCINSLNVYVFSQLYKEFSNSIDTIDLKIFTKSSKQIYNLVENKDVAIGFVVRKFNNKNVKVEPLFEEEMILVFNSNNIYPDNKKFHPNELNIKNELYLDWGVEYEIWHNFWWDPAKKPFIAVDIFSLLEVFLDSPTAWTILPISIAQNLSKRMNLGFYELSHKPPSRVCYKVVHQHPNTSDLKSIEIFSDYLKTFINNLDTTF